MGEHGRGQGGDHGPEPVVGMGNKITKPIKVIVTPTGGRNGDEIDCSLTPGDNPSRPYVPATDTIRLPVNEGPFRIQFELAGGLQWNEDNPFNSSQAKGCPPGHKKSNDNEQIFLQPADQTTLTVLNLNDGDKCRIQFRMNFSDGTYCDPIMDNGGRV